MTFNDDERSVQDSRPVELYEFAVGPVAAPVQYFRRTSYHRDFTFSGNVYTAAPIHRSQVVVTGGSDIPEMTIDLACTDPIVALYAGTTVPPQILSVLITRVQQTSGTSVVVWNGRVNYCQQRGHMASLRVSSRVDDPFSAELPSAIVSRRCNHVFGDALCGIARGTQQISPTISTINGRTVQVSSIGGYVTGDFDFGDLYHVATGERRGIISQFSTTLTIDVAFPSTVHLGDVVTLTRGCDKRVLTCRTKYGNVPNYGGHPHIDSSNFFYVDLRLAKGV